jgi:hypothetical protein
LVQVVPVALMPLLLVLTVVTQCLDRLQHQLVVVLVQVVLLLEEQPVAVDLVVGHVGLVLAADQELLGKAMLAEQTVVVITELLVVVQELLVLLVVQGLQIMVLTAV